MKFPKILSLGKSLYVQTEQDDDLGTINRICFFKKPYITEMKIDIPTNNHDLFFLSSGKGVPQLMKWKPSLVTMNLEIKSGSEDTIFEEAMMSLPKFLAKDADSVSLLKALYEQTKDEQKS